MIGYTKPLYQAQKQLEYQKHLKRLQKISSKKTKFINNRNTIQQMHKIRDKSIHYHTQKTLDQIHSKNKKILGKLMEISQRKSIADYTQHNSVIIFNNPARKRREKQIVAENNSLASRLVTKQSEFSPNKIYKAIDQYQQIKNTMKHNKRIKILPFIKQNQSLLNSRKIFTNKHEQTI